jgi:hypothetical protein
MRLKYPHIAIGALASSAPILQFEDIVPSTIFYDLVSDDFRVCILLPCAFLLFLSFFINRSTNLTQFFPVCLCLEGKFKLFSYNKKLLERIR